LILIDANLLLYAYDVSSPVHERARDWLEEVFVTEDEVGLALASLLAFLRLGTDPRVFEHPLTIAEAIGVVTVWLSRPNVGVLEPTRKHFALLADLAGSGKARGPLLMDAHLGALAIEHGATLYTSDRDFMRFRGLKVVDPLD
jgi:toxin-antitoxin system PIN domain toxin